MYNIDINFLKDRKLDTLASPTAFKKRAAASAEDRITIYIGSGVALALIALVGGAWLFTNSQKSSQERAISELEQEINRLNGQNQQVKQIQTKINNVNREIKILISVFDQLKPWSAMLSEIASVTPDSTQIRSISHSGLDKAITINGYADSYERVNDLFLTLKNSPLLNAQRTVLDTTNLVNNPNEIIFDLAQLDEDNDVDVDAIGVEIELPQVVSYSIKTAITDESSQKYLTELNQEGAIGLVSRITALQRKGVLKIEPPTTPESESIVEGENEQ